MRGKHCIQKFQFLPFGITPADAGKTQGWNIITGINWDHPRGCGENLPARLKALQGQGSPPRMRGKLLDFVVSESVLRITPADAGKTQSTRQARPRNRDHPRGCGENCACMRGCCRGYGSPPRMRGKRPLELYIDGE